VVPHSGHQEGYPLGGYWDFPYTFNDANKDGLIAASEVTVGPAQVFQGTPLPTHGGTVSTEVSFLRHFRLYGLLDGRFGNKLDHSTEEFRLPPRDMPRPRGPQGPARRSSGGQWRQCSTTRTAYFEDAGFVNGKCSVDLFAPEDLGADSARARLGVTLTGRNLVTLDELHQGLIRS